MVFKETFILFFKSSLMQLMKFARDTRLYFRCVNRARRSVVTPLRELVSLKVVKQKSRRLQHRMDYNADFIWTRNDDICQYL